MVRKAMATSKEGMRTFIRDAFLPSETKVKSTFQWKVDSFCDVKISSHFCYANIRILFAKSIRYHSYFEKKMFAFL